METNQNSNWKTFFLLVKGNIGPGCLALPFTFSMLGSRGSLPFLLLVAILCIGNMWLLVECKKKVPGAKTYGELGLCAFGRKGEVLIETFLTMSQLSICCVYFSFIANGIAPLIGFSSQFVIILLIVPIGLLSQYRHMRDLAPLSIIASVLLIFALTIIGFVCVHKLDTQGVPQIMPQFDSTKIVLFLVSAVYAFEGIGIILPIECAMEKPTHFPYILCVSMTIVTMIYIAFGEIVMLSFGPISDAGITKYLVTVGSVPSSLASVICVLVSTAVLLSYPLQLYPALQVLEIYFGLAFDENNLSNSFSNDNSQSSESQRNEQSCTHKTWTSCSINMRKILSYLNIMKCSQTVDYTSPEYKRKRKPMQLLSYQSNDSVDFSYTPVEDASTNVMPDESPQPFQSPHFHKSRSMSDLEMSTYGSFSIVNHESNGDHPKDSLSAARSFDASPPTPLLNQYHLGGDISFIRSLLRLFLVMCTGFFAAYIPNIGLLVSLAGASSGTSLALIFPPLLEVVLSKQQGVGISQIRLIFCIVSICIGINGTILGTSISIHDIATKVYD